MLDNNEQIMINGKKYDLSKNCDEILQELTDHNLNAPDFQMITAGGVGIGSTAKEIEEMGAYKYYDDIRFNVRCGINKSYTYLGSKVNIPCYLSFKVI